MDQERQALGTSREIYRNRRNRWAAGVRQRHPARGVVLTLPGRWGMVGG